jgi:ElaB/YqjD/DUF883 family membrane-anchored ribosome-binding protein
MSGWVEAFIVIAAVAIVIQAAVMVAMAISVRNTLANFTRIATQLQTRIDPILLRTNRILENSEDRIASIMGDASEVTRLARGQAQKLDRIFTETLERLRIQIGRADQILTGTLEVIEEAGTTVRDKLWGPVRKATAVLRGLQAGIDFIRNARSGRTASSSDAVREDEELFI